MTKGKCPQCWLPIDDGEHACPSVITWGARGEYWECLRATPRGDGIGVVYFIECQEPHRSTEDVRWVKIGHTTRDPLSRLAELQTGNPYPLSLLATVQMSLGEEKRLHKACEGSWIRGEWFALTIAGALRLVRLTEAMHKRQAHTPLLFTEPGWSWLMGMDDLDARDVLALETARQQRLSERGLA